MIFYDFKRGLSFTDSHKNLLEAFGNSAPSKAFIFGFKSLGADGSRSKMTLGQGALSKLLPPKTSLV